MEICDIQRVIYQMIMLLSAMRILVFAQEADENGVVQVADELAETRIVRNGKKSVPKAGWEIQKEGQGFVTVSIHNGDGYINFLDWMREASDESVKYLTVDLAGKNITIYLEEITVRLDGHYKGIMPTTEMSGNGECEKIVLLWDDKMEGQGLAMDGEGSFGCFKEKEALERELAGQNKWLKAVYKQKEGDYSYTRRHHRNIRRILLRL